MVESTLDLKRPKEPEHRLYVVLHGLVCLVDVGLDGFVAHLIDIGDEHEYLYGDWLVEKEIPPRAEGQDPFRAHLVGVDPGMATLYPTLNAIVEIPHPPVDTHPRVRAAICLPRPRAIYQALSGPTDDKTFSDVTKLVDGKRPERVASIRIFEYTFPFGFDKAHHEINKVALLGKNGTLLWRCPKDLARIELAADGRALGPCAPQVEIAGFLKVAVLHIFNEPGVDPDDPDAHNVEEFHRSTDFLGVKLELNSATKIDGKGEDRPPGVLLGEIDPLALRDASVLNLLRAVRSGKDVEPIGGTSGAVCNGSNARVAGTTNLQVRSSTDATIEDTSSSKGYSTL